jgi:hypothetical protein
MSLLTFGVRGGSTEQNDLGLKIWKICCYAKHLLNRKVLKKLNSNTLYRKSLGWPLNVTSFTIPFIGGSVNLWLHIKGRFSNDVQDRWYRNSDLMVLTNEKRGRLKVVLFDRSRFNLSRCDFQTNRHRHHPVRGHKLTSKPFFCHLKSFQTWHQC